MKKQQTNNVLLPVVIVIGALILIGVGLAFAGSGSKKGGTTSAYSASTLSASHTTFDFGTISMKDGNVSHEFELKNEGADSLKIEKVSTSCMCTTAFLIDSSGKKYGGFGMPGHAVSSANVDIGPGQTVTLEAVFDPNAHGPSGVGLAQRSIYLETNSSKSPKLELSFNATVTP